MKQYLTYHLKWQLGIIVSLPCMYLFQDVFHWPYWATIVGFQFVGALVFWPIDKFIFNMKRSKAVK
jgi:hypothetical protein